MISTCARTVYHFSISYSFPLFAGPLQAFYIGVTDMFVENEWVFLSDVSIIPVLITMTITILLTLRKEY